MKKIITVLTIVAIGAFMLTSCSSPLKMRKAAKEVKVSCTPSELEIKGRAIEAEWTAMFPQKYFNKKATLKLTPVLVYDGGEVAGPVKMLQGEKVLQNYELIKATGGKISQKVRFDYVPGMEKCQLELRAQLMYKQKAYNFDQPYVLAKGAKAASLLVENNGSVEFMGDNYQKTYQREREAEIKYIVNRSDVRKSELTKDEITQLKEFVEKAAADGKKMQYEGLAISSYASPEGKLERNEVLSKERGKTASAAFEKLFGKKDEKPEGAINIKSTAEDWDGFKTLVSESNMDDKNLILRVLSMYDDPKVREQEIRNMSKVFTILEKKVLPELRRSVLTAKIKVNNFDDKELVKMVTTDEINKLDCDALLYAATLFDTDDYESRVQIYKKAAEKYEDPRAINNYAATLIQQGKVDEAKDILNSVRNKTNEMVNNLGVIALRKGNFDEAEKLFKELKSDEAKANLGAVEINKGDYKNAVKQLEGTNSFNEALVKYLTGDIDSARKILQNTKDKNTENLEKLLK